ncbi:hypothetical protein BG004_000081, partial [Podila humilis]
MFNSHHHIVQLDDSVDNDNTNIFRNNTHNVNQINIIHDDVYHSSSFSDQYLMNNDVAVM